MKKIKNQFDKGLTRTTVLITLIAVLAIAPTVAASGFSFKLSASNNITVTQGSDGSNTITVTLVQGPTQLVTLSCGNLPAGATCGFSLREAAPTFTSILTVATTFSTPAAVTTVTVIGTGGGQTSSTQFTLDVRPAGSVGGTSLPTTGSTSLVPMVGVGILVAAIIGAAVYGTRNRAKGSLPAIGSKRLQSSD